MPMELWQRWQLTLVLEQPPLLLALPKRFWQCRCECHRKYIWQGKSSPGSPEEWGFGEKEHWLCSFLLSQMSLVSPEPFL